MIKCLVLKQHEKWQYNNQNTSVGSGWLFSVQWLKWDLQSDLWDDLQFLASVEHCTYSFTNAAHVCNGVLRWGNAADRSFIWRELFQSLHNNSAQAVVAKFGVQYIGGKDVCKSLFLLSSIRIQKIPRLLVAAADGYLYLYNLDPQEGGECTLMKQHR